MELAQQDVSVSKDYLDELLFSEYSKHYNPIEQYLSRLEPYTELECDYIAAFADTVATSDQQRFREYFKRWLVATLANVFIKDRCTNHTCLVLVGGQGYYKSTWLNMQIPDDIRKYHFSGKLKLSKSGDNLETNVFLATCLIVNIDDQLRELNKENENTLKNLITRDLVKYRRLYGNTISEYPRLASFCASVNTSDFLTDPTGSRRFLPFKLITPCDTDKAAALGVDNIYRQALYLIKSGYRYWFDQSEISELNNYSEQFAVHSAEREVLVRFFETTENRDLRLTSSEIAKEISTIANNSFRASKKRIGEALAALGIQVKIVKIGGHSARVYPIKRRSDVGNYSAPIDELVLDTGEAEKAGKTQHYNGYSRDIIPKKKDRTEQGEIFSRKLYHSGRGTK